jgi:cyclic beta-1,2-glucan synthetase
MVWSGLALMVLAFPAYMQVGRSLSNRARGIPLREHVLAERDNVAGAASQAFLATVFLLHQSGLMLDAIIRTLVRSFTRRRMLEWVTADRGTRTVPSRRELLRRMLPTLLAAAAIALLVGVVAPVRLGIALPVVLLWAASPLLAYATGRSLSTSGTDLTRTQQAAFRRAARKMWRFFDDLVTSVDHWLIPDNIQEDRRELIAHRTSPTNIGLQLLSTLAAYDFGYITLDGLLTRLEATFTTLLSMQRYRGHFYNWYDTRTLEPLAPRYISTVDSGNLAGYLVTLRAALLEIAERQPAPGVGSDVSPTAGDTSVVAGIDDAIALVEEELARAALAGKREDRRAIRKELAALRAELGDATGTPLDRLTLARDRISALGVRLHEIEETLLPAGTESAATVLGDAVYWLEQAAALIALRLREIEHPPARSELNERVERLAAFADDLVEETEFEFLFDRIRQLFSIGFNVSDGRLDASYYDTLASEARLASFVAIATGRIQAEHWFKLGRSLTPSGGSRALLSWSASMFEYLMPLLVMRTYAGTLLNETYHAIVQRHIQYGERRGVPWGISESAYNARDLDGNFQYRAFGVPGLGLKRGLADDLVIAPYASFLAAPLAPAEVIDNLERLSHAGLEGKYGFYEAIDYTPERLPADHVGGLPLPTYMAHHQGMSLVAVDNVINGSPMQRRFHADPRVRSAELLLQERIPHLIPLKNAPVDRAEHVPAPRRLPALVRRYVTPHTLSPRTHFLSNGSYTVMLTNAGGGYSRRQSLAMTRWREDLTRDAWGTFIYLRDRKSGDVWSSTYQPTGREPDDYEVTFAPDRASYRRVDGQLETRTEIVVSPEDDVELRRVSITNHGREMRTVDLTSYAEVVLAPQDADLAHPAFSNLFVETMSVPERDAIICVRRPRSGTDRLHLVHVLSGRSRVGDSLEFETDRARFLGRGRAPDRPAALQGALSRTTGAVLDPIVSLRHAVRIPPGSTARIGFTTGFADSEPGARHLIEKYYDRRAVARALALASTHSDIELRHLGLTVEETMLFQRLSGRLMYGDPRLRHTSAVLQNVRGQAELWKYGISGDMPILLVHIKEVGEAVLLKDLLRAHEYLRRKGLVFDLVVLNDHASSYLQDLQTALVQMVEGSPEQSWVNRPGGVFLRRTDLLPPEDQTLLNAAARVVMDGADGNLLQQLKRPQIPYGLEPGEILERKAPASAGLPAGAVAKAAALAKAGDATPALASAELESFNGTGGFADDGREYVVVVDQTTGALPPQPWSNVVAHPTFGFVATESSSGYTWSRNSHDNRLTPWANDPVSDPPGRRSSFVTRIRRSSGPPHHCRPGLAGAISFATVRATRRSITRETDCAQR